MLRECMFWVPLFVCDFCYKCQVLKSRPFCINDYFSYLVPYEFLLHKLNVVLSNKEIDSTYGTEFLRMKWIT